MSVLQSSSVSLKSAPFNGFFSIINARRRSFLNTFVHNNEQFGNDKTFMQCEFPQKHSQQENVV